MKVILVGAQHEKGVNDFKGANAEEYDNLVLDIVFPFKEVNSSNRKVTGIGREVKKAKCNWENFKKHISILLFEFKIINSPLHLLEIAMHISLSCRKVNVT